MNQEEKELLKEIIYHCDQNGNGFKATRARYFAYMNDKQQEKEFYRVYNSLYRKIMRGEV